MKNVKQQSGFTLIELVVVIVILGILAATAAPRFINLQDDAQTAALEGAEGGILSAVNLVYSRSLIDGNSGDATSTTDINGVDIPVAFGYPRSNDDDAVTGLQNAVDLTGFDINPVTIGSDNYIIITPEGGDAVTALPTDLNAPADDEDNCFTFYLEPSVANTAPTTGTISCI